MPRPPKSADGIDNNQSHLPRETINIRQQIEAELATKTRDLICPKHLSKNAKREWERVVSIDNNRQAPIIFDGDAAALELVCEFRSAWLNCQANWVYLSKKKRPEKLEELMLLLDAETKVYSEMRKLGKELEMLYSKFGLTPLGRAKFGTAKTPDGDPNFDPDLD